MKGRPAFVKSDLLDTGDKYEGLASERDIDKHRVGRKRLAPAFNPRALKQYQPTIHEHVDELVRKFEALPVTKDGLEISPVRPLSWLLSLLSSCKFKYTDLLQWFERLTCDLGGSISMTHNFENVRKGELLHRS